MYKGKALLREIPAVQLSARERVDDQDAGQLERLVHGQQLQALHTPVKNVVHTEGITMCACVGPASKPLVVRLDAYRGWRRLLGREATGEA